MGVPLEQELLHDVSYYAALKGCAFDNSSLSQKKKELSGQERVYGVQVANVPNLHQLLA
jgi:hypothetical protein